MDILGLKNWFNTLVIRGILGLTLTLITLPVFADAGNDLPFTKTMTTLQNAISGPFLLSTAVIMIVITCLMLAFGEWGDGFKKIINIVLWLSVAFAGTSFVSTMFVK
ncbi:MAG: TrbC/VirB2 family protein [Gammaproteobacteria bacterium]